MWSLDLHCFMVQGEQIAFTAVEDIYFLIGLPFRGTATGRAGVTCGRVVSDIGMEALLEGELHVGLRREHRGDGCSSASLYNNDDCEGVWVPRDSMDQWWSVECYGEGVGR